MNDEVSSFLCSLCLLETVLRGSDSVQVRLLQACLALAVGTRDRGIERVRTMVITHGDQILVVHLISVKANKNEDGDGWWTCSYSKAKPNAPFAHPYCFIKGVVQQAFQHHSFIPGFASRLSTAQTKTRILHAHPCFPERSLKAALQLHYWGINLERAKGKA